MSGSDILDNLLIYSKLNIKSLSEKIGLERPQALYDIQNGKTKRISSSMANRIKSVFSEINLTWLLTGEGEMLKENPSKFDVVAPTSENSIEYNEVPLLPISAQGGSLNDFTMSIKDVDCEKIVSPIKGATFAITVTGDSMAPEYPSGSQILIKKINDRAFIEWGRVYVLDTCNGVIVKRIIPSNKEGRIQCISDNNPMVFAPFEVELNNVFGIYRVMLCMSVK